MAIDRNNIPLAHAFRLTECDDPNCGPHIIALDKDDNPVIEIVVSGEGALSLIDGIQAILYKKATER